MACQQWVLNGTVHICPMQIPPPQPAPMPGIFPPPIPDPCRAHLFVLTADQVRQIVREELERAVKALKEPPHEG